MNTKHSFRSKSLHFTALISLLSISACKKETTNTVPIASGGEDKIVYMPINLCQLEGGAFDKENNIQNHVWTKISGPESYQLDDPTSLATTVRNLEPGLYEFMLTVTDNSGLQGHDTIKIDVIAVDSNEVVFGKLEWLCPMGCSIVIENIYDHVPPGVDFLVFIRESGSTSWTGVKNQDESQGEYMYWIEDNTMTVYTDDGNVTGQVDIMIKVE